VRTTYPVSDGTINFIASSPKSGLFNRGSTCERIKAIGVFGGVFRPLSSHRLCSFKNTTKGSVVWQSSRVVSKIMSSVLNGDALVGSKANSASLALHRQTTHSISRLESLHYMNYAQNLRSTSDSRTMQLCQVSIDKTMLFALNPDSERFLILKGESDRYKVESYKKGFGWLKSRR